MESVSIWREPSSWWSPSRARWLAGEFIVRALGVEPSALMVKDAILGQKYRPGMRASLLDEEAGRHVEVRINSLGFRDVEHEPEGRAGIRRVVMLGDSFAAGLSVDFDCTFPRVTERLLNDRVEENRAAKWEVITLGVAGYGTGQELLAYEEYGRRFKPAIVVLNFFAGNDVSDNSAELSNSPRPYFRLEKGRLAVSGPSASRQATAAWLNEHSRLYTWQKRQTQKLERYVKRSVVVNPVHRVFRVERDETMERAWAVTEALIARLAEEVASDGGRLLVSYIPFSDEVNPDWWEETLRDSPSLRGSRWDFDGPSRRLAEFCRRSGIAFHSPREALLAPPAGDRYYFKHGHFNERGHELYAAYLSDEIAATLRRALIAPPQTGA